MANKLDLTFRADNAHNISVGFEGSMNRIRVSGRMNFTNALGPALLRSDARTSPEQEREGWAIFREPYEVGCAWVERRRIYPARDSYRDNGGTPEHLGSKEGLWAKRPDKGFGLDELSFTTQNAIREYITPLVNAWATANMGEIQQAEIVKVRGEIDALLAEIVELELKIAGKSRQKQALERKLAGLAKQGWKTAVRTAKARGSL